MVGKLGMWGILWCLAKIFWRYYLRYRILLSLWDWYHQYSSHLVLNEVCKFVNAQFRLKTLEFHFWCHTDAKWLQQQTNQVPLLKKSMRIKVYSFKNGSWWDWFLRFNFWHYLSERNIENWIQLGFFDIRACKDGLNLFLRARMA